MNLKKEEKNEDLNEEIKEEEETLEDVMEVEALAKKDIEINDLNNRLLRLQADFVNFRKRSEKEKENSINYGIESVVCDLLPVIDNFQRALDSEADKEDSFYQGVKMIEQQLINMLKNNSVEEIISIGQTFDTSFHHAVAMEESDTLEAGLVMEVLQKGYMLKDKVIRPSMVKVSK
jgi:molecular chaperone GrpE